MAKKTKRKRDGLYLRGEIWYFRRMVGTKRVAVSTECKDKRQAERRKTELDLEMNNETFGWKKEAKKEAPTIAEYLAIAKAVYDSQDEGARAVRRLTALSRFFPGRKMDSLTITDCQTYLQGRMRFGLAQNSCRAEHIVFRAFWNRAIADHLIENNPWKFKGLAAIARQRIMSYEEQLILWPTLPAHVRRAMTVILWTGLRSSEARGIERRDCDFDQQQITVRPEVAKGRKGRIVPMPREAAQAIREQMADFDTGNLGRFFATYRPGVTQKLFPYAQNGLITALAPAVAKANLPVLTVHDLRRTFGTRCAEANVPMRVLQLWMGHSSLTITEKFYTNVDSTRTDYISRMVEGTKKALDAIAAPVPAKVLSMATRLVPEI